MTIRTPVTLMLHWLGDRVSFFVDSAKATSKPGKLINIKATAAATPADAAKSSPAIYCSAVTLTE